MYKVTKYIHVQSSLQSHTHHILCSKQILARCIFGVKKNNNFKFILTGKIIMSVTRFQSKKFRFNILLNPTTKFKLCHVEFTSKSYMYWTCAHVLYCI